MKVECAACQARYQIPDERVAGRKLKIRCRKCGGAIIVRGDQLAAPVAEPEEETTRQAPPGYANAEWHVSLDGVQHGPYGSQQMASMLRTGQLGWDAHVWRDGYAEWRVAGDSDTLVRAVAAASGQAEDDGPTRMVPGSVPPDVLQPVARSAFAQRVAQRTGQPPSAESGPYASQPQFAADEPYGYENEPPAADDAEYAEQPAYDRAAPQPGYGQANGGAAYGGSMHFGGYAQPRATGPQAMTGERNEDSVLFSAKNLAATAASSPMLPPARSGYAGGEGSGLIDIRALAALARTSPTTSPVAHGNGYGNGSSNGHAHEHEHEHEQAQDEMLALANQAGAFARLDSLAPFERQAPASSNALPIAIVIGSAMVAAAVVLGVYLTRAPAPVPAVTPTATAAQPTAEPQAVAAVQPPEPETEPPQALPSAERQAAAEEPDDEGEGDSTAKEDADDEEVRGALRSIRKTRGGKRERMAYAASVARGNRSKLDKAVNVEKADKPAPEAATKKSEDIDDLLLADPKSEPQKKAEPEAAPAPAPAETAAPAKPASSSRGRSIDELLDGAVDKSEKKPAAAAAPAAESAASGLPATPTKEQVKAAMKGVEGDVKACAAGQTLESPSAIVAISVAGATGRVSSVRVTGIQGAVGSCIARAVRNASFPKFAKDTLSINFPFRLK